MRDTAKLSALMKRYSSIIYAYYARQTPRDQRAILLLCCFIGAIMFYMFIWEPLHAVKDDAQQSVIYAAEDFYRLTNETSAVQQYLTAQDGNDSSNGSSLLERINQAASGNALNISNFAVEGDARIRINFNNVAADSVIAFCRQIEQGSAVISSITISETVSGQVNAQLVVSQTPN